MAMGKLVRLAVDKAWSPAYHHLIHLRLELCRKLFSSVGERGSVACGMAPSCLHSGNGVSGRLVSESSNSLYVELAVREEGLCSFWEEIRCLGIRF